MEQLAPTVQFTAKVNGKDYHLYMVPGSCNLRSFLGIDSNKPDGSEIITAIVTSGIGGSTMIFTEAYGGNVLKGFKEFLKQNKGLGKFTITRGVENPYTGMTIVTGVYEYKLHTLTDYYNKIMGKVGKSAWTKPQSWYSADSAQWMDTVFYKYGGGVKSADEVSATRTETISTEFEVKTATTE